MKLCGECHRKIEMAEGPVELCSKCAKAMRREIVRIAVEEGHKRMKGGK